MDELEAGLGEAAKMPPDLPWDRVETMRVDEAHEQFLWKLFRNDAIHASAFDGTYRWTYKTKHTPIFDVDREGRIYVMSPHGNEVKMLSHQGEELESFELRMGELQPDSSHPLTYLRVHERKLFIKRRHPAELFQVYDLTSRQRKHVEQAEHEMLPVTLGTKR